MKKLPTNAILGTFAAAAVLALSACGSSDKANEGAQAENVEMPAEEAMNTAEADATPMPDEPAADASMAPSEAAAGASAAAEAATTQAEKKM